jgi:hypothetical protein
MATFFSLQDGNLTDSSVYGLSLSSFQRTNITSGILILNDDSSQSTSYFSVGSAISAIAFNLSARNATPSGTLGLTLRTATSSGNILQTSFESYSLSSFTPYTGSGIKNNQNWQILKLTTPLTSVRGNLINYSLSTSNSDQLSLIGTASSIIADNTSVNTFNNTSNLSSNGTSSLVSIKPNANFNDSVYYTGTNWLYSRANSGFALSADFTIEFWVNTSVNTVDNGFHRTLFNIGGALSSSSLTFSRFNGGETDNCGLVAASNIITGTVSLFDGNWHHVAITRAGNVLRLYVDGNQSGLSANSTTNFSAGTALPLTIGAYNNSAMGRLNGYINQFRIVNGTAVYTTSFTPPTSILTKIPNTVFLLGTASFNVYNQYFITYPQTNAITKTDIIHIGSSLKGLTTEQRTITATNFASDGIYIHNQGILNFPQNSNTTLTLASSSVGLVITSDGTLNIGSSSSPVPLSTTHTLLLSNSQIDIYSGNFNVYGYPKLAYTNLVSDTVSGSRIFTTTDSISTSWLSGDSLSLTPNYTHKTNFDLLTLSSFNNSNTFTTTTSSIYTHLGSGSLPYVPAVANLTRNVRLSSNGVNLIKAAGDSNLNVSNTNLNNGDFNVIRTNNINLSSNVFNNTPYSFSEVYPYLNNASLSTSCTGKLLSAVNSPFTIEFWTYPTKFNVAFLAENESTNSILFTFHTGNALNDGLADVPNLFFGVFNGGWTGMLCNNVLNLNKWQHIAACYNGSNTTIFINGVSVSASNTISYSISDFSGVLIGKPQNSNTLLFNGSIRNVKITRNQALYASNFTPSFNCTLTSQGSLSSNVALLALTDNNLYLDKSSFNNTIINGFGTPELRAINNSYITINSDYNRNSNKNVYLNNNVFYRLTNPVGLSNALVNNLNYSNNIILSSNAYTGLNVGGLSTTNSIVSGNCIVSSLSNGSTFYNNTTTNFNIVNYNTKNIGSYVYNNNLLNLSITSVNSDREGIVADATYGNLSSTTLRNVISINNTTGIGVSGSAPIILNIDVLSSTNNSRFGIEGYNISGNLSSVILSNNLSGGIKTSLTNAPTIFDGLTSIVSTNCFEVISSLNYNPTIIKNSLLSSSGANRIALNITTNKLEEFRLENCTLSAAIPFRLTSTRPKLEGSYLFHNSNSNAYNLSSLALTGYQTDSYKEGIIAMRENGLLGNHYKYTGAGSISLDNINVNSPNTVSERLTPWTSNTKLRSTSKLIPVNFGDTLTVSVVLQRSSGYTGDSPRLVLVGNASLGYSDSVLSTSLESSGWETITGTIPAALNNGVVEVYVDCSGNVGSGYINIDSWNFY